jgi:hypothetical protein
MFEAAAGTAAVGVITAQYRNAAVVGPGSPLTLMLPAPRLRSETPPVAYAEFGYLKEALIVPRVPPVESFGAPGNE